MGGFMGIGGGDTPSAPKKPKQSQADEAEAAMRRRAAGASGYRSTILNDMYTAGLKAKTGQ